MAIQDNKIRIGRFTSSKISCLAQPGKRDMTPEELFARPSKGKGSKTTTIEDYNLFSEAALTYIDERNMERECGRSLTVQTHSRPLSWGQLVQHKAFKILGTDYEWCADQTIAHAEHGDIWVGSPDCIIYEGEQAIEPGEIKCPATIKSFIQFARCKNIDDIREKHPDGETYYWQLVSNGMILESTGKIKKFTHAQLIIYCPYEHELESIKELASQKENNQALYYWIFNSYDNQDLPHIVNNGKLKNIYIFAFEVPQEDQDLLKKKVVAGGEMLIKD